MAVILGARDTATGKRMMNYLNRAAANGGTVGVVPKERLSVPQTVYGGGSDGEYTGGFRLVDMSETVKETDEEGNETEKLVPKLGVWGVGITDDNKNGTLYFSMGATVTSIAGIAMDVSDVTDGAEHYVYAYWTGSAGNVLVTKTESISDLAGLGAHMCIPIGSYKVTSTGVEVKQLFQGVVATFFYRQPYLASITGGDPVTGYSATLSSYPTPDNPTESTIQGHVFLSECCLGDSSRYDRGCYITVHPVAMQVLEAEK